MEIKKGIQSHIIMILLTVGFCMSVPIFAMAEETTAETEEGVATSDTSDSASQPATDSEVNEEESRVKEADNSPVVSPAEPDEEKDKPDDNAEKKEDEEEETDVSETDTDTTGMSMEMGGAGTGSEGGVFYHPVAVSSVYTGAASYGIPIAVPPGRNGMQPNISLSYNSYAGNGLVGVGWDIDMGFIQRSTKYGVDYSGDDFMVGSKDLVSRSSDWGSNYYGAKIEGSFTKYYKNPAGGWVAITKSGKKFYYGTQYNSRQVFNGGQDIFKWFLDKVLDKNGNYMTITYTRNNNQIYPSEIKYTAKGGLAATKSVIFNLESRDDVQVSYETKYRVTTLKRLKSIEVRSGTQTVRKYNLTYQYNTINGRSQLQSVQMEGTSSSYTLPATEFGWLEGGDGTFGPSQTTYVNATPGGFLFGDIDGDGLTDLIKYSTVPAGSQVRLYVIPLLSEGDGTFTECQLRELGYIYPDRVSISVIDVNNDGWDDIVFNGNYGDVWTILSLGNGSFGSGIGTWGPETHAIFLADIDGDGFVDLIRHNVNGTVYSCLSNGNGSFQSSGYGVHTGMGGVGEGRIMIADLNGDGYSDLIKLNTYGTAYTYLAQGDGTFSSSYKTVSGLSTPGYNTFSEINGDGLADIVVNDTVGHGYTYLSKGDGSFSLQGNAIPNGVSDNMGMGDVNGDGLLDIVQSDGYNNYTFISNSNGTFRSPITAYGPGGSGQVYLADVNGDGMADLIKDGVDRVYVSLAQSDGPADRIELINNHVGGRTTISYTKSSLYPNGDIPFVVYPVSEIETNDGNGVISGTTLEYADGYYDDATREFRGFGYVQKTNPDNTTVETWYNTDDEYKKGRAEEIQFREPGAQDYYKRTIFTRSKVQVGGSESYFVRLDQERTDLVDSVTVYTQKNYTYNNNNGNTMTITTSGTDAENITTTNAWTNKGNWTWRLTSQAVSGSQSGLVRKINYTYFSNGDLETKTFWYSEGTNPVVSYTYDTYGNLKTSTDPNGNTSMVFYDTTYTFPTRIRYPSTGGGTTHEVEMDYDDRYGTITDSWDENDNHTQYAYDEFGRLMDVYYPDGGHTEYEYYDATFPRRVHKSVKESGSSYIDTYQYFDGLGRPVQAISYGHNNKLVVNTNEYDEMGRNYRNNGPFYASGSPRYPISPPVVYPYTETTYDDRGRPSTITKADGEYGTVSAFFSYQGLSTIITDADGKDKTTKKDYLGRILQVIEEGNLHTYYDYNAAGDLLAVEDSAGNITEINYDTLGRKKNMDDPDMGYWTYTYDANGNLTTQTDAKSQVKTFYYDELNRLEEENYSSDYPIVYTYDQGINGIGQLYKVTKENLPPQIDTYTRYDEYDAMGRVREVTKWINGSGTFTTGYNYDLSGKVTKITYPDAYEVDYAYYPGNNLLYTATGSDSEEYAKITYYTPSGQISTLNHGNGVTTWYTYDSRSMRLKGIQTRDKNFNIIQYKDYQYTPAGDIDTIIDTHNNRTFVYSYDNLHRLIEERTNSAITASYAYNNIGNITSKSMGTDNFNFTSYHAAHKHAVQNISLNGSPYNYTYDDNGNMTSGPDFTDTSQVGTRTISYNADNMPTQVTSVRGSTSTTVNYRYDGFGQRYKKEVVGGMTTYYLGDHFEIKGGTPVKYIFVGNLRVAQVEGTTHTYLHKDHLGSSTIMTDDSGFETESTQYMPFGSPRPGSGEITDTSYLFTDQEFDTENGLYNYNARLYDPVIGRFISADTIVPQPFNPQSLNRYTYCLNNPLIYVDPSGHEGYGCSPFGGDCLLDDVYIYAWPPAPYPDWLWWELFDPWGLLRNNVGQSGGGGGGQPGGGGGQPGGGGGEQPGDGGENSNTPSEDDQDISEISWGESSGVYPTENTENPSVNDIYHPSEWNPVSSEELQLARAAMDLIGTERNPDVQRDTPDPNNPYENFLAENYHDRSKFPEVDPAIKNNPNVDFYQLPIDPNATHPGISPEWGWDQSIVKSYGPFWSVGDPRKGIPPGPIYINFYEKIPKGK